MTFAPLPASIEFVRAGKLRALAVTTAVRSEVLPEIPTVAESVPGYEASGCNGLVAPRDTPVQIIEKINQEINAGLSDPKIKSAFGQLGGMVLPGSPADFGTLISNETDKWGQVIRESGIKAE